MSDVPEDVREALGEVQQYLSDVLPPLIVAGSISTLLELPPHLLAGEINGWTQEQLARQGGDAGVSDYFYHAVSKLHMVGEFRLVARTELASYLGELGELLVELCPARERGRLAEALARVADAHTIGGSTTGPKLALGGATTAVSGERHDDADFARSMRRLTFLLKRLEELPALPEERAEAGARGEIESRILAGAIGSARSADELRLYQDHLARLGVDATPARAFRVLGGSLPAWADPRPGPERTAAPVSRHSPREAMRRLVVLDKESGGGAVRFRELVSAAVEQFNSGSLARAVTMLDTAARLVEEGEVGPGAADAARAGCHETLDHAKLGKLAASPESHALLRRLMGFFPAFAPDALLDALQVEERRDRRRVLLQLLEVLGSRARSAAFGRLKSSLEGFGFGDFYLKRNLLLLLRRIPRDGTSTVEEDVAMAGRLTENGHAPMVVKEAVALLAQSRLERAEKILAMRLKDLETMLVGREESVYARDELLGMLDRVVSALARLGTASSRRAVVRHGLRRQPELGDALGRLAELGSQDLAGDGELVRRLLDEVLARVPRRVLGVTVRRDDRALLQLVTALSGTHDGRVLEVFRDLVQRFPAEEFSEVAERALAAGASAVPSVQEPAAAMLGGDLELMDLPTLLQNLAATQASGVLRLAGRGGSEVADIELEEGKLLRCRCSGLSDEAAFFQLFERPQAKTFTFSATSKPPAAAEPKRALEVVPLLFEAMRRFDELAGAAAVAPDEARFRAVASQPPHVEGSDAGLVRVVWARAASGSTALACENGLGADSYAVRRLLAHWVEEGALEPVARTAAR